MFCSFLSMKNTLEIVEEELEAMEDNFRIDDEHENCGQPYKVRDYMAWAQVKSFKARFEEIKMRLDELKQEMDESW